MSTTFSDREGMFLQTRHSWRMTLQAYLAHARGAIGSLILAPVLVGVAISPVHFRPGSWGQFACNGVGWLLFLIGAVMRWWATLYVGARKNNTLVTEGPYSMTRNPIYFGTFLLTLSISVLAQSVVLLAAVILFGVFYVYVTVATEERQLTAAHGDRFQAYCRQVPRFFPNVHRYHTSKTVIVNVKGLRHELVRMSRWAWIPLLCELFTHLRCEAWWPLCLRLP